MHGSTDIGNTGGEYLKGLAVIGPERPARRIRVGGRIMRYTDDDFGTPEMAFLVNF
jgi:hypothetical protein